MDIQSFLCNGRRILLPMDLLPEGHTFSVGVTGLQSPTSSRRRVPAHLIYICDDITTPLSSLNVHSDLVSYGGLTEATSLLALVDGQPPPNFRRPAISWSSAAPVRTPALEFRAAQNLTPSISPGVSMESSSSVPSGSDVLMAVTAPNFGAIQVPPVVTLAVSPVAATATSGSSYPPDEALHLRPSAVPRGSPSPDSSPG